MTESNFDILINNLDDLVVKTAVASQYNLNCLDCFDKVTNLIEQKKELIKQEQNLKNYINLQPQKVRNIYYDYFTGHYTFWNLAEKYNVSLRQTYRYIKKLKDFTKGVKQ